MPPPPRGRLPGSWPLTENQFAERATGGGSVGEGAQNVHPVVGHYDSRARLVLDGELGLSVLAGQSPDGTRQVVSLQLLHCGQ